MLILVLASPSGPGQRWSTKTRSDVLLDSALDVPRFTKTALNPQKIFFTSRVPHSSAGNEGLGIYHRYWLQGEEYDPSWRTSIRKGDRLRTRASPSGWPRGNDVAVMRRV